MADLSQVKADQRKGNITTNGLVESNSKEESINRRLERPSQLYSKFTKRAMSEKRSDNVVAGSMNIFSEVGSVSIAPYEYAAVYDYLGKNRYLQASFCKSVAKLYSDKFGMYTTKALSNFAAEEGSISLLQWSRKMRCRWDKSVFVSGAKGGHVDVIRWLIRNHCSMPRGCAAWIAAAARGRLEALKFAYDSGYLNDIQILCEEAAKNCHLHILKWVHEIEGTRHFDAFTCDRAAMGGCIETVKWLRSIGCKWNGRTCETAIRNGHLDVLNWALDNGCPWDVKDRGYDGKPALHYAKNAQIIEFLVSRGANINAVTDAGGTPVYYVARDGKLEAVKTLVRAGADVNICDVDGRTPLDVAIEGAYHEIVEVLRAAGARESR